MYEDREVKKQGKTSSCQVKLYNRLVLTVNIKLHETKYEIVNVIPMKKLTNIKPFSYV